jgi:hypothetical protein
MSRRDRRGMGSPGGLAVGSRQIGITPPDSTDGPGDLRRENYG